MRSLKLMIVKYLNGHMWFFFFLLQTKYPNEALDDSTEILKDREQKTPDLLACFFGMQGI